MRKAISLAIATILCLLVTGIGMHLSFLLLPAISEPPPDLFSHVDGQGHNWIGQSGYAIVINTFLLVIFIYLAKWKFVKNCHPAFACYWYCMLIAISLPYSWFLIEPDWYNPFIFRIACWIGGPISIWFVPTLSLLVDLVYSKTLRLNHQWARYFLEILLLMPIWWVFFAFFSFWILRWGWI